MRSRSLSGRAKGTGCGLQPGRQLDCGGRCCVSGLLDRHAGRGLDGNRRALLISSADRLAGNRLGHRIWMRFMVRSIHSSRVANCVYPCDRIAVSVDPASKVRPFSGTLRAIRASLLARSAASLFPCMQPGSPLKTSVSAGRLILRQGMTLPSPSKPTG